METKGYLKISRRILDMTFWQDPYDGLLFFYCLLRASYNRFGFLKPGQLIYSVQNIAKHLNWGRNCVAKHIQKLSSRGLIKVEQGWPGSVMTICVWDELCGESLLDADLTWSEMDALETGIDAIEQCTVAHQAGTDAHYSSMPCTLLEQNQKRKKEKKETSVNSERERQFLRWWKLYPRHEGQQAARNAWMEMRDIPAEVLLEALENAKRSNDWMKDNGKYIPSAAKWLDGKWEDYVSQPKAEVRATWTEY